MTVIAWDGRTLAADKRVSSSGLRRTTTKIFRVGTSLYGCAGNASQSRAMRHWLESGADPAAWPAKQDDEGFDCTLLQIAPGPVVMLYTHTPYPIVLEDAQFAMGSGRDYALAAMHLGCDARRAVEVASHFETSCGDGIDGLSLQPIEASSAPVLVDVS